MRYMSPVEIRDLVGQGKSEDEVVKMIVDEMGMTEVDARSVYAGAIWATADDLSDVTD